MSMKNELEALRAEHDALKSNVKILLDSVNTAFDDIETYLKEKSNLLGTIKSLEELCGLGSERDA